MTPREEMIQQRILGGVEARFAEYRTRYPYRPSAARPMLVEMQIIDELVAALRRLEDAEARISQLEDAYGGVLR